jgi:hypothetical protein
VKNTFQPLPRARPARAPLDHGVPVHDLIVDVEAATGEQVGTHFGQCAQDGRVGRPHDHDRRAIVPCGPDFAPGPVVIGWTIPDIQPGIGGEGRSRRKDADPGAPCVRREAGGLHEGILPDHAQDGAADLGVIERRPQVVGTHDRDRAGRIDIGQGDRAVGPQKREKVDRRRFEPVYLAVAQRDRRGGRIGHDRPFHPFEPGVLGA